MENSDLGKDFHHFYIYAEITENQEKVGRRVSLILGNCDRFSDSLLKDWDWGYYITKPITLKDYEIDFLHVLVMPCLLAGK